VGAHGQLTRAANGILGCPRTKYQRSNSISIVTCIETIVHPTL